MERSSQIFELKIDHDGQPHRASYFVENDKIFTSIGGRVLIAPLGPVPAADTVRSLLSGHLQKSRKTWHMKRWTKT